MSRKYLCLYEALGKKNIFKQLYHSFRLLFLCFREWTCPNCWTLAHTSVIHSTEEQIQKLLRPPANSEVFLLFLLIVVWVHSCGGHTVLSLRMQWSLLIYSIFKISISNHSGIRLWGWAYLFTTVNVGISLVVKKDPIHNQTDQKCSIVPW